MNKRFADFLLILLLIVVYYQPVNAQTEICQWKHGKKGAVSITFDDGSINQFRYALPILDSLQLPATFYIITGAIPGSEYKGKFIGRPVEQIINEAAQIPTDSSNYFERASAAKYLGYRGANAFYDSSAILYEDGNTKEAFLVMDALYKKIKNNELRRTSEISSEQAQEKGLTWDSIRAYAKRGHEFASHTITHAHMTVLDTPNLYYELEKSRQEIQDQLGAKYTFSAEIPFGIEHPRAMKYSLSAYAALRNLMTDPYLTEINRGYKKQPGSSDKEYVQWQRGPTSGTSLPLMQSWVDITLAHKKIWLVLVFHGVDGIGYEALPHELLNTYFSYIQNQQEYVWVATFSDVAKYMRERMASAISTSGDNDTIVINIKDSLDKKVYDVPLTLKTYIPSQWRQATLHGSKSRVLQPMKDEKGSYVTFDADRSNETMKLTGN